MFALATAVAFVGALCLLDLVLSVGIIRRLREQNATLERLSAASPPIMTTVPVGSPVGDFTATTTTGSTIHRDAAEYDATERLFVFLSPGCQPCEEQLPALLTFAARRDVSVIAIIAAAPGSDEDSSVQSYVTRLAPVASVVVESGPRGVISQAFQVAGYPAWYLIDTAGLVLGQGTVISKIPLPERT